MKLHHGHFFRLWLETGDPREESRANPDVAHCEVFDKPVLLEDLQIGVVDFSWVPLDDLCDNLNPTGIVRIA